MKGGRFQPVHLFTRHKLRAGWGLPTAFPRLLGLLTPSSEAVGDPWNGGQSGWVGPAWPSGKLGGGLPCPPGLSPPPPPGPGWVSSLTQSSCVLVVARKVGGGRARPDGVSGLICWEWGGGWGHGGPPSQSLLCLPWQLRLRNRRLPSCPTKDLPPPTAETPYARSPSPPALARSKPRPGMPQVRPSRGHQNSSSEKVSRAASRQGPWHLGCG